jgi:hypothetical protein
MPDRYALIAVPVLCCAYLAYDRYGSRSWRRLGPGLLCGGVIALLPLNVAFGFQFRDWYHARVDPFANDVAAGVPVSQLTYFDPTTLVYLHQARLGVFTHLQEHGLIGPGQEIDGFDVGGGGWYTLGGASSTGVLEASGTSGAQKVLRWDYNAADGTVPVLGRAFPAPQDWRGAGAIAFTVVGQATGRTVDVRLATSSRSGGVDRYDSSFVDDQVGTRTVAIPWDGFAHATSDGHFDPQGPVPLQHVVAVAFGVVGPAQGRLVIQRVALEPGHPALSWPSWSASTRRSLPPWR